MFVIEGDTAPSKQLKSAINKKMYPSDPLDFIAFSLVLKESKLGASSHERFLMLDSKQKTLQYYSTAPKQLPSPLQQEPGKETIQIKKTKSFTFRSTRTGIGKARVEWIDLNGKKAEWILTFSSNLLMNQWVVMVNEVLKDGHLKPENRPKSVSKRETQVDPTKFLTNFMKETGAETSPRNESLSQRPQWLEREDKNAFVGKNNTSWLLNKVAKKEEKNEKQLREQMKGSQQLKHEQNVKNEEEGRSTQIHQHRIEHDMKYERGDYDLHGGQHNQRQKIYIEPVKTQVIPKSLSSEETSIKKHMVRQVIYAYEEVKKTQIDVEQNRNASKTHLQDQQLYVHSNYQDSWTKASQVRSEILPQSSLSPKQSAWIPQDGEYQATYIKFLLQCQGFASNIAENITELAKSSGISARPYEPANKSNLQIEQNGIEYRFSFDQFPWWSSSLKTKQYSSMVNYIRAKKVPHGYDTVYPLPICLLEQRWVQIFCKVMLPRELLPISNPEVLDKFYGISSGKWKYYRIQKTLIVDYDSNSLEIDSTPDQPKVQQILKMLFQNAYAMSNLEDFSEGLKFQNGVILDDSLLVQMLNSPQLSTAHSGVLRSFYFGIKCSELIKLKLHPSIFSLSPGKLLQQIDTLIKLYTDLESHHPEINSLFEEDEVGDLEQLNKSIVFTSIAHCLGLQVEVSRDGRQIDPQNSGLRFSVRCFALQGESLCEDLHCIQSVLKAHDAEPLEEAKCDVYEKLKQLIQLYESKCYRSLRGSLFERRFLNLSNRVKLTQSVYQAYSPSETFPIGSPEYRAAKQVEGVLYAQPASHWSYLMSINCVKWMIKSGDQHEFIVALLEGQIEACRIWSGAYNSYLLQFYQLYSMYARSINDFKTAIDYGRISLHHIVEVFGENSPQAVQKWYQLGNIMFDCDLLEGALEAYSRAMVLLKGETDLALSMSGSRSSIREDRIGIRKKSAQLIICIQMAKIRLALGEVQGSLSECSESLNIQQDLRTDDPQLEIQVLSLVMRCYEIKKNRQKIIELGQVMSQEFSYPKDLYQPERDQITEKMLKVCLAPYIWASNIESGRRKFLLALLDAILHSYSGRYSKRQYHEYASLHLQGKQGILQNIVDYLLKVPMFYPGQDQVERNLTYSLYEQGMQAKIPSASQPKLLPLVLRMIESVCGIVGAVYFRACLI